MLGGRVTVPLGDYPVDLFINDGNLRIECEPGTILRAANTNPVVTVSDTVTGPFVLTDADIRGQYKAQEGVVVGKIGRHTSELQSLMRISYAVFCLKKKKNNT